MAILRVEGLKRAYGERIVGPASFTLEAGEMGFVVGDSGSGKSTILDLIYGTRTATAGAAILEVGGCLPIGCGQTISQPSLVAQMIELSELKPGDKVLEVGTGSGYQTALLAELGYGDVFSVEIIPQLYERAKKILNELGYTNVKLKLGDGYYGWPEYAPYDAIVVTAAAEKVPPPLIEQLDEGGILLIPIGPRNRSQTLWKLVKENGKLTRKDVGNVIFVPFVGDGIRND